MRRLLAPFFACSLLAFAGCFPYPFPSAGPLPSGTHAEVGPAALELQVHRLINERRASLRLPPLSFDARVAELARLHSRAMATGERAFGHDDFPTRARAVRGMVPASRAVGENVALNLQAPEQAARRAVHQWLSSADHRETIDDPSYAVTGIGVARNAAGELYFTQLFVELRDAPIAAR